MIETTIEWYTLDEKLPFDGESVVPDNRVNILCVIELTLGRNVMRSIETLTYENRHFIMYSHGELFEVTNKVKYWAYVPEIGVE